MISDDPTATPISNGDSSSASTGHGSLNFDDQYDEAFPYMIGITSSAFVVIGISGYVDAGYFHINDFFQPAAIFSALLQFLDIVSDIFLSLHISSFITTDSVYIILFISSIIFIVIPILISIFQLMHTINKHWWHDDNIKLWLTDNSKLLYFLSVFSGSSFTAIQLMNSNLFSLNAFSMGLTHSQSHRFQIKRVYSIVLVEVCYLYITRICEYILSLNGYIYIELTSISDSEYISIGNRRIQYNHNRINDIFINLHYCYYYIYVD